MREQNEWLLMYHWDEDCGSCTANSIRLCVQWLIISETLSFPHLSGKIFLPAYNHLIAIAILKEFHLAMVVFCHFLTFFFPFVLLFCFDSSCDYILWLQDGLLQSLENFLNSSLLAVSNKLPPFY